MWHNDKTIPMMPRFQGGAVFPYRQTNRWGQAISSDRRKKAGLQSCVWIQVDTVMVPLSKPILVNEHWGLENYTHLHSLITVNTYGPQKIAAASLKPHLNPFAVWTIPEHLSQYYSRGWDPSGVAGSDPWPLPWILNPFSLSTPHSALRPRSCWIIQVLTCPSAFRQIRHFQSTSWLWCANGQRKMYWQQNTCANVVCVW